MNIPRTIFTRHYPYLRSYLSDIERHGFILRELKEDTVPKKNDVVLYTDVGSFRTPRRYTQLKNIAKVGNPLLLILIEPKVVLPYNYVRFFHKFFDKVLTWNEKLIDNKKYVRSIALPVENKETKVVPFSKRKFIVTVVGNKGRALPWQRNSLYERRMKTMRFLHRKLGEKFDMFGMGWDRQRKFSLQKTPPPFWRGTLPKNGKLAAISKYRFTLCYENAIEQNWVTEKLWDAMLAKTIPVYWGAPNIHELIPKNIIINRSEFKSDKELLKFLRSIDEPEFMRRINAIERFLHSAKAKKYYKKQYTSFVVEQIKDVMRQKNYL